MSTSTQFLEFLYQALASPIGIVVETNDPQRLRQRLYVARREAKNPALDALTICISRVNPATELWIFSDA